MRTLGYLDQIHTDELVSELRKRPGVTTITIEGNEDAFGADFDALNYMEGPMTILKVVPECK
jgi:hypothetical protein